MNKGQFLNERGSQVRTIKYASTPLLRINRRTLPSVSPYLDKKKQGELSPLQKSPAPKTTIAFLMVMSFLGN
jgi:hypothetical protein